MDHERQQPREPTQDELRDVAAYLLDDPLPQ
jgi:hypothetical protein